METTVYEIHRSEAITALLKFKKHPQLLTNIELGDALEDHFPNKAFLVREDNIELEKNIVTAKTIC
jgi:hypothetical protein